MGGLSSNLFWHNWHKQNSMGGEFWFYYHLYWITPNNRHFHTTFEGKKQKKRIKVSLIITVHSAVTTCASILSSISSSCISGTRCGYWLCVMYHSVTSWVIIGAHKHPFIVVIGLILHPSSIVRREGAVIVNIIVLVALCAALWPDLSLMCLYLLCWTHYHISTTHRRSSIGKLHWKKGVSVWRFIYNLARQTVNSQSLQCISNI